MVADESQAPRKRPRLLPGEDIDDKSKKVCNDYSIDVPVHIVSFLYIYSAILFILYATSTV